ncbi:transketolase [Roseiconus lacunae]|uniref:transketolase n=1 Tax=Roseiconus lacunae TaxID=2605694 RepID=UPI00308FAEA4|nr:transketolase [Stieleria sp. HD01]
MSILSDHRSDHLEAISRQVRRWILQSTAAADSGHPTSSLSAVELMVNLMFGGVYRFAPNQPECPANDHLIFSKGHASPLYYSLWAAAGLVKPEQLSSYRQFGSQLEGHPTSRFELTEAATGSLGQGLSIGVGMAISAKYLEHSPSRTFVLIGDSEMAEGAQWEALQLASHYKLDNLIGILDVNRLGQRGETMYGHDLEAYRERIEPFGWRCILIEDGHDSQQISDAYAELGRDDGRPVMLIARTIKGKGVPSIEDEGGYHGKPVDDDAFARTMARLSGGGELILGEFEKPLAYQSDAKESRRPEPMDYHVGAEVATRDAYGNALKRLAVRYPELIALDGEVCNSTRAKTFRDAFPDRFFEMFIAEQNMVGAATGLALRGKTVFVSTFAAFLSRAFDQIRMAPYSGAPVKFVGSHCGVSIGQDGPSQMGLEDIAMFRTIQNGIVLYPSDAVATECLVDLMAAHNGIAYLRTTRGKTPVIYDRSDHFEIGGCKVLRKSTGDKVTLIGAGITVHECLNAHGVLQKSGIACRVIDLYSIKPLDHATVRKAADETEHLFTVEDHFPEGGLGEAILTSLADHPTPVSCLAVRRRPISGKPEELLNAEGLSAEKIVDAVISAVQRNDR